MEFLTFKNKRNVFDGNLWILWFDTVPIEIGCYLEGQNVSKFNFITTKMIYAFNLVDRKWFEKKT